MRRTEPEIEFPSNIKDAKNDLVRLIELKKYPSAQLFWTATETKLNRRLLDARKSTTATNLSGSGSLADSANQYGQFAVIFIDYNEFDPQNGLIKYHMVNGVS